MTAACGSDGRQSKTILQFVLHYIGGSGNTGDDCEIHMGGLTITSIDDSPLSLDLAKGHLRVQHDDENDSITLLIDSAFDHVERITGRLFRRATCELTLRSFADIIELPRPSLRSITSIEYFDSHGDAQTLDAAEYIADTKSIPGSVEPSTSWPTTANRPDAVTITFEAGQDVFPKSVHHAVLMWIDLEFHDHSPAKSNRIERRILDLVRGLKVRSSGLTGISD